MIRIALSLQQPWAWLYVNGYKPVENRSWSHWRRGPLLIHASKKYDLAGDAWVRATFPEIPLPPRREIAVGGMVGGVRIVDCVKTMPDCPWFFGPFGFVAEEAHPLPFAPARGHLGFFRVNPHELWPDIATDWMQWPIPGVQT